MIETRKQLKASFNLFSGVEFDVAPEQGLTGHCDFILSRSHEKYFVETPVVMLVGAQNENINGGLGQCIAEMVEAQLFNQQEQNSITTIYGVVTTGTIWKFLRLVDHQVEIDLNEPCVQHLF